MPRLVALEWDSREARVALATTQGRGLVVDELLTIPLSLPEEGRGGDPQVGNKIQAALSARGIRKADALVAVGRASIELKQLTLPPAPDNELPDMVRFQAQREFHSLGDDWPLDFMLLPATADGQRPVLAASIAPEVVEQISSTCNSAGLKPLRLVLRPCALASLFWRRAAAGGERIRLLVDLLSDEADLVVVVDDSIVFMRTARIATEQSGGDAARSLLAEVRRTLAAVHNQLSGQRVEAIYLFGAGEEVNALAERMTTEISLPARVVRPLDDVKLSVGLATSEPTHSGRFAPLLGMLLDAAEDAPQTIDFLHPRRRPDAPSRVRKYAPTAVLAALLLLLIFGGTWWKLRTLDARIQELAEQSKQLDPLVKEADLMVKAADEVDRWSATQIVWLEELRELCGDLPKAQDAMLTSLRFSPQLKGGTIELDGVVREVSVVDALEVGLRDKHHTVEGKGRQQDGDRPQYPWRFKSAVTTLPRSTKEYAPLVVASSEESAAAPASTTPSSSDQSSPSSRSGSFSRFGR